MLLLTLDKVLGYLRTMLRGFDHAVYPHICLYLLFRQFFSRLLNGNYVLLDKVLEYLRPFYMVLSIIYTPHMSVLGV